MENKISGIGKAKLVCNEYIDEKCVTVDVQESALVTKAFCQSVA